MFTESVKNFKDYVQNLNKSSRDYHLQEVLQINLGNEGSEHWLEMQKKTGFDIKKEVKSVDDLVVLEEVLEKYDKTHGTKEFTEEHLREMPISHFTPKKYLKKRENFMCPSSGSTGQKKSMIWDQDSSNEVINFYDFYLNYLGFPHGEKWWGMGPDRLYQKHMEQTAYRMGAPYADIIAVETRGSKEILESGDKKRFIERFGPSIEETRSFFSKEKPGVGVSATQTFEMLPNPEIFGVDINCLKGILCSGTGTTSEAIKHLSEGLYKDKKIGVAYGHFMWGLALGLLDEKYDQNYFAHKLYCTHKVVNPRDTAKELKYGEHGQIKAYITRPEFFYIIKERDAATKIPPKEPFGWDGVKNVEPIHNFQ